MNIFKRSFPYNSSWKHHLITALRFGVFIMAFLLAFKPFGLNWFPVNRLIAISGIYAFVTFGCIFSTLLLLPLLFPSYFKEKSWTTGKQIVHVTSVIVLIGLVNYFISP